MSTDRELLELAAKAYGLTDYYVSEWDGCVSLMHSPDPTVGPSVWDPLDDDGDALRLAVKLGLYVEIDKIYEATRVSVGETEDCVAVLHRDIEVEQATRRAIVLAAAEIGRVFT